MHITHTLWIPRIPKSAVSVFSTGNKIAFFFKMDFENEYVSRIVCGMCHSILFIDVRCLLRSHV